MTLVLALLYAIHIVRQPAYPQSIGDPSVEVQDLAFKWRDKSCDILIDGDSTAGNGLNPRTITARTGLSACNIAANRNIFDDLGTMPLDVFLAHNPKPKLLVFQMGAEDFYRDNKPWEHVGPFAPLVLLARDLPLRTALSTMAQHPAESVQFEQYILHFRFFPHHNDREKVDREFHRWVDHVLATDGQVDLNMPAQTACLAPAVPLYGTLDRRWLHDLREKYQSQGIAVLVRVAPLPACDPQLSRFKEDFNGAADGPLETLPIDFYVAGDRHVTQQGTEADTEGLIQLIRAKHPDLLAGR